MSDIIAILALGVQYLLIVLAINWSLSAKLSFAEIVIVFLILASVGIALWHRKTFAQTPKQWRTFAVWSIGLGVAFFVVDSLLAVLHGQFNPFHYPGGLLGLPLTFFICPGGTIICLAGLARASYIVRRVGSGTS
jgi:hypothetical protein